MKFNRILVYFLLGGIIGFAINFTWSFQQNLITFTTSFVLYLLAGHFWKKTSIPLKSYKTLLLFWYIILVITYASFLNYSWDLPVLLTICVTSFLSGYFLPKIKNVKKRAIVFIGLVLSFITWLYFTVPWITYKESTDIEFKDQKIDYQLYSINANDPVVSSSTMNGKVVLLDFWYKSCGVCFRQYPKMEAVFDHFKNNKNVAIYFVNNGLDSTKTITEFIKNKRIRIPVLIDKNSLLVKKLKLDGFPAFLLIDKKGCITEMHIGYSRDEASVFEEQTIAKIDNLLKQ